MHLLGSMFRVVLLLTLAQLSMSSFDPELHAKYKELPREQFIQYFNSQNYTWKIKHHPHLDNMDNNCLLNATRPSNIDVKYYDYRMFRSLPDNFDAREKWPDCVTIGEIYNQGRCGSCWAFGTATVASDRTCIEKGLNVRLSEQDFDCLHALCFGGSPTKSFPFWQEQGLVSLECRPYDYANVKECVKKCVDPSINYNDDKHFAEKVYTIESDENIIKTELFTSGPIFAGFMVYEDFMNYTSGIYEHKYGNHMNGHAVKVIGYGVENGVNFWLAANSWGPRWGENGFFRIKRYQDLIIPFEAMLYAGHVKN